MDMTETQPHWRFARMTPAQINQDPVQGEFFSRESDLPGRLVREANQNSLDAARDGETVRVRFRFSGQRNALSPEAAAPYLEGLEKHVGAIADKKDEQQSSTRMRMRGTRFMQPAMRSSALGQIWTTWSWGTLGLLV